MIPKTHPAKIVTRILTKPNNNRLHRRTIIHHHSSIRRRTNMHPAESFHRRTLIHSPDHPVYRRPDLFCQWKKDHPEYLVGSKGTKLPYGCNRWSSVDYGLQPVRDQVPPPPS